MTQEVRITVDANLYCRHAEGFLINEAKFEWKKRLTDYIKANAFADHKFVNVKVDIIPHDNDRDYTEADAEKHLNGEPEKKRKTYADDYFEKFPNAPKMDVLTASWGIVRVPYPKFEDVYGSIKAVEVGKTKNVVFPNSKKDHFALWMSEMDDGE